ncbi:bifunctional DNA primase/polymerase [Neomegalonema sp.]|uniref:bifunctional DNA primase/polymerase n=1 Tax=Neomegalonema sp. TaxID=2039713 RepID=UPI00262BE50C|nr:bifunctional DNA primase/polymerase [Neomegalonema sp.]MDD2869743.1 bifunctional DNA primase/polymerase [Neomegalonema sp.]
MNASTDTLSAKGRAATKYAERGFHVFPIMAGHKGENFEGRSTHHLPKGHLGASCNPDAVRAWWTRWPDANIGLHLAASGLVAIDADTYKPDCGWLDFISDRDMPETLAQTSARGGEHYIFRSTEGEEYPGKLCAGVEIKHKGYILLEPSTFADGVYRFQNDAEPAPCPEWMPRKKLSERAAPGGGRRIIDESRREWAETALHDELGRVLAAGEGERNNALNRAAFSLAQIIAEGRLGENVVRERLFGAARSIGLDDAETLRTINSAFKAGLEQPRGPKEREHKKRKAKNAAREEEPFQPEDPTAPQEETVPQEEDDEGDKWPFRLVKHGVEKRIEKVDKETGVVVVEWRWICSPLEVVAETRSINGEEWGRLLSIADRDGRVKTWCLPMRMLAGDGVAYREQLLSLGLILAPSGFARAALHEYVTTASPGQKARCVSRIGWASNGVFVLPKTSIGDDNNG